MDVRKPVGTTRLLTLGNAEAYEVMGANDLRGIDAPPLLIEDLLVASSICGLTALPGIGKTFLALEIARAVSTGGKVMGQFKVNGGPQGVLIIESDSSAADLAQQWRRLTAVEHDAWRDACDPDLPEEANPVNPFGRIRFLIQSTFMLDLSDEVRRVIVTALDERIFPTQRVPDYEVEGSDGQRHTVFKETGGCALIVLDTLSRLTTADQNNNSEMERVLANARVICEVTGAAVLLLHHNSKPTEFNDGTDFRGASSSLGALDSWLNLSSHKKTKEVIRVEFKKFRGIRPDNFEYKMNVSDPELANLAFLGNSGGFFGADDLKDTMLKAFTDWKRLADVDDELWPSHSDHFSERAKFKKALANRLKDLYPHDLLRRPAPKKEGDRGRPAYEYKVKESACPSDE
jgi:hypothetical protein